MARNYKLKERATGVTLYPETSTGQVYGPDGNNLETTLPRMQERIDGKQEKLATSEGLTIEDGMLSLTERAKQMLFDDMFKAAAGSYGTVDHAHVEDGVKKPYYLNELWLTYEEAVAIHDAGAITSPDCAGRYAYINIRTNLPPRVGGWGTTLSTNEHLINAEGIINDNSQMTVLNLDMRGALMPLANISDQGKHFIDSKTVREVIGRIQINHAPRLGIKAPNLESIRLYGLFHNCDLSQVPKINLESISCLVKNKYDTHPSSPVVTVHPDVYAKLTDESNDEWHQVLLDAIEKNISFATV